VIKRELHVDTSTSAVPKLKFDWLALNKAELFFSCGKA
jgi:hypothetical protein